MMVSVRSALRSPLLHVVSMLLLVTAGVVSGATVPSSAPDVIGQSGTPPSANVATLLADATVLMEARKWGLALATADHALEIARGAGDRADAALAQRARAAALHRLKRSEEAVAAWREATAVWEELDDRSRQVEGLASIGVLLLVEDPESQEGNDLIEQALELADEEENVHPLPTAQALHDAGNTALASKQQDNAIRLFSAAVGILDRYAPDSVALAESLIGLGTAETSGSRDPAVARAALGRALDIVRRVSPGSALEAECLYRGGMVERAHQNFPAARDILQQALAVRDVVDPAGNGMWRTLIDLGVCEAYLGDLDEARRHVLRALAIMEKLSADPTEIGWCVSTLGSIELYSGNLEQAEAYYQRSVELWKENGGDFLNLAQGLINLGNVSAERWRFDVARSHYEEGLALLEQHASTHVARGKALNNLREVTLRQGDLSAAEAYSLRAITFYEENYPDSIELSFALNGAGNLALKRGDPLTSRAYHERALEIRERKAPGSHFVSESMRFVAEACLELGELDHAEVHLRQGLEIVGGDGATGQDAAQIVSALGKVAYRRGDFAKAASHQRRAVELWQGCRGPDHPMVAEPLRELGEALQGLGRSREAFDAGLQSESVRLAYLRTSSRTLTEREALAYGAAHQRGLDLALTLAADEGETIPNATRRAFDAVIRSRAVVLDEVAARNRHLWTATDPELAALAEDYAGAGDDLARLVVQGPADDAAEYQTALDDARAAKDHAERALASRSSEFRCELAVEQAAFVDVQARLSREGALVAFVRFDRIAPPTSAERVGANSSEVNPSYAAFVLPAGSRDPVMVSLGSAEEIDRLVAELRGQISSTLAAGALAGKRSTDQYRLVGTRLRERVWDQVARQLGDSKRVFVVPDGALNLVELAALPVGESQYLAETGPRIHYLSAERDVLGYEGGPSGGGLLALGDPAFDEPSLFAALAPDGAPVELEEAYRVASAATYRGLRSSCAGFASMHFEPLPETGDEVDEVVRLWRKQARRHSPEPAKVDDVMSLRGASASEAAFKNLASNARVVHLATHGFFLGEGCPSAAEGSRSTATGEAVPAVAGESPLLLSGFALAGANHRNAAGPEEEDGILTAEEIASLNLTNVDWAVLSACDTGVGEVRVGEGVFGLRRAFQVAGARTLIMSLWPVEDETTRKWMKALYDNRFAKGMSTIDAVHEANHEVLHHRREAGLSTHPAYWAGFIASGDWQ